MKGDIISYNHKDIYFLETKSKPESTNLLSLFASQSGQDLVKLKPHARSRHKYIQAVELLGININQQQQQASHQQQTYQSLGDGGASSHHSQQQQQQQPEHQEAKSSAMTAQPAQSTVVEMPPGPVTERRSSIELYNEAAAILGLTCEQTNDCKCIECQCHYFDFDEELDSQLDLLDHPTTCSIQ